MVVMADLDNGSFRKVAEKENPLGRDEERMGEEEAKIADIENSMV